MSSLRFALFAILASLLLVLVPVSVATAHDELIGSSPEDGDVLQTAPEELRLTYSGDIAEVGAQVRVTGPGGAVEGDLTVEGVDVVHTLPADLGAGDYETVWRVTSSDGHPISGELTFSIETADVEVTETPDEGTATATAPPPEGADATAVAPQDDGSAATDAAPDASAATVGPEAAARTDAPVSEARTDQGGGGDLPTWAWVAVGVALVALGGVGVAAVRRREP